MKKQLRLYITMLLSCTFFSISFAQWESIPMLETMAQHAATSSDSKIFIGPGNSATGPTNKIYVYDLEENDWTEVYEIGIEEAGAFPSSVYAKGRVFVAGGLNFTTQESTNAINILYVESGTIDTASLSEARYDMGAVVVGDKVIFAGGMTYFNPINFSDNIDIYHLSTQTWSTATLSEARGGMAVAVADNIAIFAGGHSGANMPSDAVDIYNASTDTWSTATLSDARAYVAGTTVGDQIFIAGGMYAGVNNSSDVVDIYNTSTGSWSTATLSEARGGIRAVSIGKKAFFIGGGPMNLPAWVYTKSSQRIDIYDAEEDSWSIDSMAFGRINHAAVTAGNCAFVAGGVDFSLPSFLVETMESHCEMLPSASDEANVSEALISPNPTHSSFTVELPPAAGEFEVQVFNLHGKFIQSVKGLGKVELTIGDQPIGMYLLKVLNNSHTMTRRIVKS